MKKVPIINCYHDNQEIQENLVKQVNDLMDSKKGILGMDEPELVFDFYLSLINRSNNWDNRRILRQFLVTAPLEEQFSAVLLSTEFMEQCNHEAIEFFDLLTAKGLLLGVRLDRKMSSIFGSDGEYIGTGVDNMVSDFNMYKKRGCLYSKWRSKFQIKENRPTLCGTEKVANRLAKFAAISQACGLVPIVSVEVVPDGNEDIFKARRVLEKILINLTKALNDLEVLLEATIIQVSLVQTGRKINSSIFPETIADQTLEALKKSLPIAVGGLMFHSSGLSEENATQTLNHIILKKEANVSMLPWRMTYSFGRAQKVSAIVTWGGYPESEEAGHREIMTRANANNQALLGEYIAGSLQGSYSNRDLFIANYVC